MAPGLKQALAVTLSFILCVTGMPAAAVAEVATSGDLAAAAEAKPLEVLYRTRRAGTERPDEEGWTTYASDQGDVPSQDGVPSQGGVPSQTDALPLADATQDTPEPTLATPSAAAAAPLDDTIAAPFDGTLATSLDDALVSLQMKLGDEALQDAIAYRLKGPGGTWQESWTSSPNVAEATDGIAGVQARLVGEPEATYDLWYRAQLLDGTWLDWVQAPGAVEAPTNGILRDFQATISPKGERPATTGIAGATGEDPSVTDTPTDADQPQDELIDVGTDKPQDELVDVGTDKPQGEQTLQDDALVLQDADGQGEQAEPDALEVQDAPEAILVDEAIEVQDDQAGGIVVLDPSDESTDKDAPAPAAQGEPDDGVGLAAQASAAPSVVYRANVQKVGWQSWVKNGTVAGTTGKSRQARAFRFKLSGAKGGIQYRAHVQGIGWQKWVSNGAVAGITKGAVKRVEAIRLALTGSIANDYNIWYRAHVSRIGWQRWVKNGTTAGTTGKSLPIEAIEVLLVKKTGSVPVNDVAGKRYTDTSTSTATAVRYQGYVSGSGWVREVRNGSVLGPANDATPLEALRVVATGVDGGIQYRTHVSLKGWTAWKSNGAVCGPVAKGTHLEAVRIRLTGNAQQRYDVYYRVYAKKVGWMAWTKNGSIAGSVGHNYGISAVQVRLVRHGASAPTDATAAAFACLTDLLPTYGANLRGDGWQNAVTQGGTAGITGVSARVTGIKATVSRPKIGGIAYRVCGSDGTWRSWKKDGAVAGVSNSDVTALRFKLTGDARSHFNVWYRVHVAYLGWLGWTKNGAAAGTDSQAYPVEAYEVVIRPRGAAAPGQTARPYYISDKLNGVDISGWDQGIDIANTSADFVIIKSTEGLQGTIYNPWYYTWATQVLNSGRLLGFYHYAKGEDPLKEADAFFSSIQAFKGRAVACLDWEGQGNDLFDSGKDVAWCKKFLDRLKLRFGGTPLIYMSKSVTNRYDWSSVASSYPLWGAQYASYEPVYGYESDPWQSSSAWGAWGGDPLMFQYTSTGVLEHNGGIDYFDFDLFYGSATDWRKLQS